ncbi:MAG TPA: right-handed parallel beta-helix repeat-containing protein [Candidatus Cloacimonadota bacterium]|nr:right-handed parallel beta-helix repeat-containing protein [Candidatus Cloacimonadota bacterium]
MKLIMSLFVVVFAVFSLMAQTSLSSYTFGYSVWDYSEITDGIVLGNSSTDNQNFLNPNQLQGSSETSGIGLPIGFSFYLSGYRFDRLGISANGWIALGQSQLAETAVNMRTTSSYTPISSVMSHAVPFTVSRIAGLAADLQAQTGSEIRVHTYGNAPFRVCVVQWKNYKKYGAAGAADSYNFQIRLLEGTNIVEIQYGSMTTTAGYEGLFEVGLRSAPATTATNWINRKVYSNWDASEAGTSNTDNCRITQSVYPALGATFTFIAPAVSAVPALPQLSGPANNAQNVANPSTISWQDNGGWTTGYKLYLGTNNPPTNIYNGTDIGYVYSQNLELQYSTQYYWRIAPYNMIGDNNSGPVRNFTTVAPPLSGFIMVGGQGAHYADLNLAIDALNLRGVGDGGLQVYLNQDSFTGNYPTITATGYPDKPIAISPAPGFSPVINATGGSSSACLKLVGSDYISIEGIAFSSSTAQYGIWIQGSVANEVKNINISNCNINLPSSTTQNFGILVDGVTDSLLIANNTIAGAFNGIYISGGSNSYLETKNARIIGNTISNSQKYGIYAFNASLQITGNTLTLNSVSTQDMYGIYCGWGAGVYNVAENTIQNGNTSRYFYGLYSNSNNATFSGNTIQNCQSSENIVYGSYMSGGSLMLNNSIANLTAPNFTDVYGIYLDSGTHTLHGNTVRDIVSVGDIYGIYARAHNHTISANKVMGISHTGSRSSKVCGVYISSASVNKINNNMIGDLSNPNSSESIHISGIHLASGSNIQVYHNSILLDPGTDIGYGATKSAALYITGGAGIDIRNNIFVNKISSYLGSAVTACIWKTSTGLTEISLLSDGNIYYVLPNHSTRGVVRIGSIIYNTLDSYQAISGARDQNSFSENVPFVSSVSPFNLKINPSIPTAVEGGAIPIAGFSYDFEGDFRGSSPDIGADEGDFMPIVNSLATPEVSVTMIDSQLVLRWQPVPNAVYYKVLYSVSPDSWDYDSFHTTTATQYVSVPWIKGFFRVIACR